MGKTGYIVRKGLVHKFARQYPVPTYVCEFLLGRYCASINEEEIQEGLGIVEDQLRGGLNLGGSLDQLQNAIDVVELAVEKGASLVLMPVTARKQLVDLSDEMATKVNVLFYSDVGEAFMKAIAD